MTRRVIQGVPLNPNQLKPAYDVIRRFVDEGRLPGAVAQVGSSKVALPPFAYGRAALFPQTVSARPDTIYDCASLTKVVCTATLTLILLDEDRLHLDEPLVRYVPEFIEAAADPREIRSQITIRHLLTHTSGLSAWKPLYEKVQDKAGLFRELYRTALSNLPGTRVTYSCLGFILLGIVLERIAAKPLDQLARERIFAPLGMDDTGFNPPPGILPRIAPTERLKDNSGETILHGVVHDENARALGGISGNAGLFSSAPDLARFAQMILRGGRGTPVLLSQRAIKASTRDHTQGIPGERRGLGWLLKDTSASPVGDLMGQRSFGHTGYTGTSLWIDPAHDLFIILLTNRVHPSRQNDAHLYLRPLFHNAVAAALY